MANERRPSKRQQPDDQPDDQPNDEWDDLLDEPFDEPDSESNPISQVAAKEVAKPEAGQSDSRPMRSRKNVREEELAGSETVPPRRRPRKDGSASRQEESAQRSKREVKQDIEQQEEFRPEDIEGAERTKDGLIRVREGAPKSPKAGKKQKEPWLKSLGVVDYIGLAASLVIFVGLAGMLLTWMYGEEWGADLERPDPVPEVPVAGALFNVTAIDSYWRRRTDSDRAPSSEIIIPEVTIEVEAVGSEGFLSVLFLEPSGAMSADSGNLTLSGGQITVKANEGRKDGANRFTFSSTKGYTFEPEFRSYISLEEMKPWTIEIVETREFGSSDSKRLAYFEIARDARTREVPVVATAAE